MTGHEQAGGSALPMRQVALITTTATGLKSDVGFRYSPLLGRAAVFGLCIGFGIIGIAAFNQVVSITMAELASKGFVGWIFTAVGFHRAFTGVAVRVVHRKVLGHCSRWMCRWLSRLLDAEVKDVQLPAFGAD